MNFKRRGQGMTEYILIVALIAIGTLGIVTVFGNNIRGIFNGSTNALAGTAQATNNKASEIDNTVQVTDFATKSAPAH